MTSVGVGFSDNPISADAAAEAAGTALDQGGIDRCDLAIVYATAKHDHAVLHAGVRSLAGPAARIVGGGAAGIITNDRLGYDGAQVGVAMFSSDSIAVDLFVERNLADDEYEVGRRLGAELRRRRFAGEPKVLVMFESVRISGPGGPVLNSGTRLLAGMLESDGAWPAIAGCGLLADFHFTPTYQWVDDELVEQSALALVLSGSVGMDTEILHGLRPMSSYHTVTATDENVVLEIDERPALEVIDELMGPSETSWEEFPLFVTLGVNKGEKFGEFREEDYVNQLCIAVDKERRGLVMFEPYLRPGVEVQLMRREIGVRSIAGRVDALFARVEDRSPLLALYFDCAGRARPLAGTEEEEGEAVQEAIGKRVPLLGLYTGIEMAPVGGEVQPLDWTGVLCLFTEPAEPR
jgi:hypothetical protein